MIKQGSKIESGLHKLVLVLIYIDTKIVKTIVQQRSPICW